MTSRLEKTYRSNEWKLNKPVSLTVLFGDDALAPSPIDQEHNTGNLLNSIDLPSLSFEEVGNYDFAVDTRVDKAQRVRVNSIEDDYLLVDNFVVTEKSLYPKTMKHQNSIIETIALYVHQSLNYFNPKYHPVSKNSKEAYKILYHPVVYILDLLMCVLLLLLTCFEQPLTLIFRPYASDLKIVTSVIEFILIVYFVIDLVLRYIWLGKKRFFRQKITFARLIGLILVTFDFILYLTIPFYYNAPFFEGISTNYFPHFSQESKYPKCLVSTLRLYSSHFRSLCSIHSFYSYLLIPDILSHVEL